MKKPKILIVEDNVTTADGLGFACESESMTALVTYNGTDALSAFNEHEDIDIVVLDIGLPDINGFELYRKMKEQKSTPVVFMTNRVSEVDEVCGLEMGADGYVKKPVQVRTMIAHIRMVLRRTREYAKQEMDSTKEIDNKLKLHPDFKIYNDTKIITFKGQPLDLTKTEFIILSNFIRHPLRVFSREQIISMVDDDSIISPSSVNVRIFRIRQKLKEIDPDSDLLVSCRGIGYKLM